MFLMDAIAPIANRVLRMMGIDTKKTNTWLWPEQKMVSDFSELTFKVGQQLPNKIWVVLDGVTYECEGVDNGAAIRYGNLVSFGKENTGEPFALEFNKTSTNCYFGIFDPNNPAEGLDDREYTLGIYTQTETITPIDPKYLPSGGGGGLPVVELSTEIVNEAVLTADEGAMLTAAAGKRLPTVLRFPYADNTMTAVAFLSEFDGGRGLGIVMGIQSIQFYDEGGTWSVVIE